MNDKELRQKNKELKRDENRLHVVQIVLIVLLTSICVIGAVTFSFSVLGPIIGVPTEYVNNIVAKKKVTKKDKKTGKIVVVASEIVLKETEFTLRKDETWQIEATVYPDDTHDKSLTFTTGDPTIATVTDDGVVTAVGEGETYITVITENGLEAKVKIIVEPPKEEEPKVIEVEKIIVDTKKVQLIVGDSQRINAYAFPTDAEKRNIKYISDDPSVATVNQDGKISAIKQGSAVITCYTENGTKEEVFVIVDVTREAKMLVEFKENGENSGIKLNDEFPIEDSTGKARTGDKYEYTFKITVNAYTEGVKYYIYAKKVEGSTLDESYVKQYLRKNNSEVASVYNSGVVKTFDQFELRDKNVNDGELNARLLYDGVVTQQDINKGYIEFTYKMWLSDTVTDFDQVTSKTFKTKIIVEATNK